MKYILMLAACLVVGPLVAETIGHVEYHLPKQNSNWKMANEFQGTKKIQSTTRIYIPENTSKEDAQEFFGVHVNSLPIDLKDEDALKKGIERGMQFKFVNPKVTINILEKSTLSVLYEWSLNEEGQEKFHGWTRMFSTPNETTMLTYQTEQLSTINDQRPIWIKILKEAKVIKS